MFLTEVLIIMWLSIPSFPTTLMPYPSLPFPSPSLTSRMVVSHEAETNSCSLLVWLQSKQEASRVCSLYTFAGPCAIQAMLRSNISTLLAL